MADYFTQFSCILDVGSADNAARANEIHDALYDELERNEAVDLGFLLDKGDNPGQLWIHSDGHGDPEHVVTFVLRCAAALNLTGLWGFTWGLTCSRPRPGGFGGGAQLIDLGKRESVETVDCEHWLKSRLEPAGEGEPARPAETPGQGAAA